jgi:hypothetical protein
MLLAASFEFRWTVGAFPRKEALTSTYRSCTPQRKPGTLMMQCAKSRPGPVHLHYYYQNSLALLCMKTTIGIIAITILLMTLTGGTRQLPKFDKQLPHSRRHFLSFPVE